MTKGRLAKNIETAIGKHLIISNKLNGDDASDVMALFFSSYFSVGIPYVLGLLSEGRQADAQRFVEGEINLFASTFRSNVVLGAVEHGIQHPWHELTVNEKLVKEILEEEND